MPRRACSYTSRSGTFCSRATRAQSSYSGENDRRPSLAPAELALHRAPRRLHRVLLAVQLVPRRRVAADAERRRLAEQDLFQRRHRRLGAQHAQQHAGAVLLHEDRRREHVEGAGGEQQIVTVADHLRRHVVEVRLQDPDLIASRAATVTGGGSPYRRRHAGCSVVRGSCACRRRGRCARWSWPATSVHSCTTVVRMAAPVGVVSSALIVRRRQRHALEQFGRARRRHRHQAVGALAPCRCRSAPAGW